VRVAPAGVYVAAMAGARRPIQLRDVEVKANLTETRVF
jgi:hypothetical protein